MSATVRLASGVAAVFLSWAVVAFIFASQASPRNFEPTRREFDRRLDPKIGSIIVLLTRDVLGRRIDRKKTLLIDAGPCSECSLKSFNPASLKVSPNMGVVVAYATESESLVEFAKRQPSWVYLVSDRELQLRQTLNAAWFPRAYVFGSQSELLALQTSSRTEITKEGYR
ncbi:MAG: hypothetical protein IT203_03440 [Fimbriimonadaceae bacterium]|nr:hypothetical protein [Fimbriimonadaceae bacterium]